MTRTLRNRTASLVALALALALGGPATAPAHDGNDHLMGTVKSVQLESSERTVSVETREGKRVTVVVDGKTKFLRGQAAAREADLVAGVRVVIDARTVDGKVVAREIRLGPKPK